MSITKVKGLTAEAMKRYSLTDDDYYISSDESGDKVILNRRGIDKVEKKIAMTLRIESIQTVPYGDKVCTTIVATGRAGDLTAQRIASANPDNVKGGQTNFAEIAEKRVRHRLLLSLADLYEHGIFSDVESDKWMETRNRFGGAVGAVEKALNLSERKPLITKRELNNPQKS